MLLFDDISPTFITSTTRSDPVRVGTTRVGGSTLLRCTVRLNICFASSRIVVASDRLLGLLRFRNIRVPRSKSRNKVSLFERNIAGVISEKDNS